MVGSFWLADTVAIPPEDPGVPGHRVPVEVEGPGVPGDGHPPGMGPRGFVIRTAIVPYPFMEIATATLSFEESESPSFIRKGLVSPCPH